MNNKKNNIKHKDNKPQNKIIKISDELNCRKCNLKKQIKKISCTRINTYAIINFTFILSSNN